jgi:hypothetical protein
MKPLLVILALAATSLAGPLDRPGSGLEPAGQQVKTFPLHGTVFQKMEDGVLVRVSGATGREGLKGLVFLAGNFPQLFQGNPVHMQVSDAGTYSYGAVSGAGKIIRKVVPHR